MGDNVNSTYRHPGTKIVYIAVPVELAPDITLDNDMLGNIATAVECVIDVLCQKETDSDDWTMVNDVTVYSSPQDAVLDLAASSPHVITIEGPIPSETFDD